MLPDLRQPFGRDTSPASPLVPLVSSAIVVFAKRRRRVAALWYEFPETGMAQGRWSQFQDFQRCLNRLWCFHETKNTEPRIILNTIRVCFCWTQFYERSATSHCLTGEYQMTLKKSNGGQQSQTGLTPYPSGEWNQTAEVDAEKHATLRKSNGESKVNKLNGIDMEYPEKWLLKVHIPCIPEWLDVWDSWDFDRLLYIVLYIIGCNFYCLNN